MLRSVSPFTKICTFRVISTTTNFVRYWSLFQEKATSAQSNQSKAISSQSSTSSKEDHRTLKVQQYMEQELKKSKPKKTMAQLDEELRAAMEGHAGDGGVSGVELEDGKPVAMKRGVRDNMFRYI